MVKIGNGRACARLAAVKSVYLQATSEHLLSHSHVSSSEKKTRPQIRLRQDIG